MSELKACPFCGKDDELYSIPRFLEITKEETKEVEWAVGCTRCDVHLYRARYAKNDGIATWNTRPIEDELRAELARRNEERNALADENRMLSERIQRLVEGVKSRDEIIARLKEDE